MNTGLKQRLVGAVVLIAVAIIFVPSFLRERQVEPVNTKTLIPEAPERESVRFENPEPVEGIEPAPEPETMFLPDDGDRQPVVDTLEEAQEAAEAPQAETEADPSESSTESSPEPPPEAEGESEETAETASEEALENSWVLQVASLSDQDSALALRDRLRESGYRAYVRSAQVGDQSVSRVFVGPRIDRAAMDELKAEVDEALSVDSLILRFEP